MRPLRLTLEGFTCYKQRQPLIDFSQLSLFCITGPTGVGKSSLLDAMIFALYGRVPRVGKSVSELVSLGAERMSVLFDFELAGKEYRLSRVLRRGKGSQAQLADISSGLERSVAGGVQQVDAAVERLIGLGYEAFTRAVVLPQGEFAHFLKSPPREQREILRDLLRLSVYERMRKEAADQLRRTKSERESLERRLEEDFAGVGDETIQRLRSELSIAGEELAKSQRGLESLAKEKVRLAEMCRWVTDLDVERRRLAELDADAKAQHDVAERVSRAREVQPLLSQLDRLDSLQEQKRETARRFQATEETRQLQEDALEVARARLSEVRLQERELPDLRSKLKELDELQGLIEPRQRLAERVDSLGRQCRELEEFIAENISARDSTARELEVETQSLVGLDELVASLGRGPEPDELTDALSEAAAELSKVRGDHREVSRARDELRAERDGLVQRIADARAATAASRRDVASATRLRDRAKSALDQARQQDVMAHLRSELAPGGVCPVCEQRVSEVPKPLQGSLLDTLSVQFEAREAELVAAESRQDGRQGSMNDLTASRRHVASELSKQNRRVTRQARRLEVLEERLRAQTSAVAVGNEAPLEDAVLRFVGHQREQRNELDRHAATRVELSRRIDALRLRHDSVEGAIQRESASYERLKAEAEEARAEKAGYDARMALLAEDGDLPGVRARLAERIDSVTSALREAETVHGVAEANLRATETSVQEMAVERERLDRELREMKEDLEDRLRSSSFSTVDEARDSVITDEEIRGLDAKIDLYRRQHHSVSQRVEELTALLAREQAPANPVELFEKAEAEWSVENERVESAIRRQAELETQIVGIESRLDKANRLSEELKALVAAHANLHRLATDLRSENFQAYLLEQSFSDLVRGASGRLGRITSRYTLDYSEGAFHVFDHDHASELRSTDTLSGGETFLVSLMLALELSAQVQNAPGAVPIDSLFIDEGFGTLDPETLELVASALEALQTEGRMVGVITHLTDLTERLPGTIRVERDGLGSRVRQDGEIAYNTLGAAP